MCQAACTSLALPDSFSKWCTWSNLATYLRVCVNSCPCSARVLLLLKQPGSRSQSLSSCSTLSSCLSSLVCLVNNSIAPMLLFSFTLFVSCHSSALSCCRLCTVCFCNHLCTFIFSLSSYFCTVSFCNYLIAAHNAVSLIYCSVILFSTYFILPVLFLFPSII